MFKIIYRVPTLWNAIPNHFSHVWLFVTTWTVAHQAPLAMGFSRQEYCSGLPHLLPGDLPNPGIKPVPPALQVDSLPLSYQGSPGNAMLLLLLLSRFSCVWLCATPQTAAHQAPPSLGFSLGVSGNTGVGCHFLLQCMKVKSESEVTQSCPTLRDHMDCSLPGTSVHGIFQARVLELGEEMLYKMLKGMSFIHMYQHMIFMIYC